MSGMRRSMITTSGRRLSVSATADAPSAASPMTRMRGERERASRSPSRTTSWSSAMRQVISSATPRFYGVRRQAPLSRRSSRMLGQIASASWRGSRRDEVERRRGVGRAPAASLRTGSRIGVVDRRGQVRTRREQRLVALDLLGPVARERFEEVLADSGPQVHDARPDRSRTRCARGARRPPSSCSGASERPGRIGATADSDLDSRARRACARPRAGSSGGAVPGSVVRQTRSSRVGSGEAHLGARPPSGFLQHVDVADDERAAGDDRERRPARVELGEARARQPEPPLGGLVRIRRRPERDLLALPRPPRELAGGAPRRRST